MVITKEVSMPKIGEIRKAKEVGRKGGHHYIWHACVDCGKERWIEIIKGMPVSLRCYTCASRLPQRRAPGASHHSWKGGRHAMPSGYIEVWLSRDDFFYPMIDKRGYVREHRLVVAKALNRCLLPWEIVHHKGDKFPLGSIENKQDNRYPENLELLPARKYHLVDTVTRSLIATLQKRVTLLEAEVILLKSKLKEEQ